MKNKNLINVDNIFLETLDEIFKSGTFSRKKANQIKVDLIWDSRFIDNWNEVLRVRRTSWVIKESGSDLWMWKLKTLGEDIFGYES